MCFATILLFIQRDCKGWETAQRPGQEARTLQGAGLRLVSCFVPRDILPKKGGLVGFSLSAVQVDSFKTETLKQRLKSYSSHGATLTAIIALLRIV